MWLADERVEGQGSLQWQPWKVRRWRSAQMFALGALWAVVHAHGCSGSWICGGWDSGQSHGLEVDLGAPPIKPVLEAMGAERKNKPQATLEASGPGRVSKARRVGNKQLERQEKPG